MPAVKHSLDSNHKDATIPYFLGESSFMYMFVYVYATFFSLSHARTRSLFYIHVHPS